MDIIIDKLIWSQWNIDHMSEKHSVNPEEVLTSMKDPHMMIIPAKQKRIMLFGRSGRRLLSTILNNQGKNKYFVVTSRDMSKKEREFYRSKKGKNDQ